MRINRQNIQTEQLSQRHTEGLREASSDFRPDTALPGFLDARQVRPVNLGDFGEPSLTEATLLP